jgi:hypothetical protein
VDIGGANLSWELRHRSRIERGGLGYLFLSSLP